MTLKAYMDRILKAVEGSRASALGREEASQFLGISERTLEELKRSYAIPFVRIGGRVVFLVDDLNKFLKQRRITCLSDDNK